MIGVHDVLEWLKISAVYNEMFTFGYCGKLDTKPQRALGVYPLRHGSSPYRAYEGLESYEKTPISLLIHYSKNIEQSQYAADKLFRYLRTLNPARDMPGIDDTYRDALNPSEYIYPNEFIMPNADTRLRRKILLIDMLVQNPVFVGTDDNGVYEFVIEFEIFTEKENE